MVTNWINKTNHSLGWKGLFEALWPSSAAKISVVMTTIENHKSLLDREVTLGDINDARTARARALEEYERNEVDRQRQTFEACKLSLAPRLYDQEMERMKNECCKDTCAWLSKDEDFKLWFDSRRRSSAFLWLSGIPGAGQYQQYFILPLFLLVSLHMMCFPSTFTFNHSFKSRNIGFESNLYSLLFLYVLERWIILKTQRKITPLCQLRVANAARISKHTLRIPQLSTPRVNKSRCSPTFFDISATLSTPPSPAGLAEGVRE